MEKVDRLGWAAGIAVVSYGMRVGLRTNRADRLPEILDRLPPNWKPASSSVVDLLYSVRDSSAPDRPGVRHFNLVYRDGARLSRTTHFSQAMEALETDLQLSVAAAA